MSLAYDTNNIFAKILRGEIPNNTVFENEHVLAFHDIAPKAPVHVVIIPKGSYTDVQTFSEKASTEEKTALFSSFALIAEKLGLPANGYRLITNCRDHGGQEVPHLHFHMLGGAPIGPLVSG